MIQSLHYFKNSGTNEGVVEGDVEVFVKFALVGMRVFATSLWSPCVDATGIIGLQKRAGGTVKYPVAILIHHQVLRQECGFADAFFTGDTRDIGGLDDGRIVFAALCALQAIGMGKYLLMHLCDEGVVGG